MRMVRSRMLSDSDWPSEWMACFAAERAGLIDQPSLVRWRAEWLARLAAARALLLDQLLGVDEQTLVTVPVHGEWTAKDVLAHAAAWDAEYVRLFNRVLKGGERIERWTTRAGQRTVLC